MVPTGKSAGKVVTGPVIVDGALVRNVSDGTTVFSETWDGSTWVRGGVGVAEVWFGRPASSEELTAFGAA